MIPIRYADIDLSTGQVRDYPLSEEAIRMYLGGKGLAAYILYKELAPGIDPLSPDNILIINTTPLTGTGAPCTSRFNATSKNVLTGGIASSNCGGTFGIKLRRAGYDGLIIRGKSPRPCCLMILDGKITISDAEDLWGLNTEETQQRFDQNYGTLVIGPAGEHLVRYACAVSGERVLGRCGIGAVMGSKNIKAIAAYGTKSLPISDPKSFRKDVQSWVKGLQYFNQYYGYHNYCWAQNIGNKLHFYYRHFSGYTGYSTHTRTRHSIYSLDYLGNNQWRYWVCGQLVGIICNYLRCTAVFGAQNHRGQYRTASLGYFNLFICRSAIGRYSRNDCRACFAGYFYRLL